ncbi:CPBP family glutamic-type intramembrane protease [Bacillus fonticola]|uniref:CPBP family glutamic-type intramembrane protease n=1 Tax=Bacillus fonticola TaxID=2728853 RepID=UPI0014743065|nr:CPBP family glutamic-type intramembrane protease [Bacillus fonticola]
MHKQWKTTPFLLGVVIVHALYYVAFQNEEVFWYVFTVSMLFLLVMSLTSSSVRSLLQTRPTTRGVVIGAVIGLLLWAVATLGLFVVASFIPVLIDEVKQLFATLGPTTWWQWISVFLIVIPAEQLLYRGWFSSQLQTFGLTGRVVSITMYASPLLIMSGFPILAVAAVVAGVLWEWMLLSTRSLYSVIVSHMVMDGLLLLTWPSILSMYFS